MPRIAIILLAAFLSTDALAGSCGARISAFNTYEDYDDKMNKEEGVTLFEPVEFSPHSAFEGLVVDKSEKPGTKLEIEVKKAKSKKTKSFSLVPWKIKAEYLVADGLDAPAFIGFEPGTYVLRLTLNGRTLCEDHAREIPAGH